MLSISWIKVDKEESDLVKFFSHSELTNMPELSKKIKYIKLKQNINF